MRASAAPQWVLMAEAVALWQQTTRRIETSFNVTSPLAQGWEVVWEVPLRPKPERNRSDQGTCNRFIRG